MKVVVCDYDFTDVEIERGILTKIDGLEFKPNKTKLEKDELIELVKDADGIINQWSYLTKDVIDKMENCKVIATYGIGTDKIDVKAATEKGIYVCNVPDYGVNEVADHTIGMMLGLLRRIVQFDKMIREGNWNDYVNYKVNRIEGLTVGLLGFGKIPKNIAKKLINGFGMKVLAYDPFLTEEQVAAEGATKASLEEIFTNSDVVSVHVPLNKDTKYLIREEMLNKMKPTAVVINCGRGAIVNEDDLYNAVKNKKIAGAALDVFEKEPLDLNSPLLKEPNIIVTPHSAYFAEESVQALREGAANAVFKVLNGEQPINVVNKELL
ncbi:MAG: C-terminal binding protein [Peptoniphilus sp.]|nr:C-terminal binding protein [Peptoniphilus sp.]